MRLDNNAARRAAAAASTRPASNTLAAGNAVARRVVAPPAPVQNDRLLRFEELNPAQQHLFGANGAQTYARLSSDDRAVFLLLTRRMDRAGLDYSGLTLKDPLESIRRNRLLFNDDAAGLAKLKASVERGVASGEFYEDKVFGPFHPGIADGGVRQTRRKWSMQLGWGEKGAFVDMDRYNYKADWKAWLGHAAEIIHPGRPNPLDIARELGEDLNTRTTTTAPRRAA